MGKPHYTDRRPDILKQQLGFWVKLSATGIRRSNRVKKKKPSRTVEEIM